MNLYQWQFGYQPHYIVAVDYADAERTIREKYGAFTKIKRMELLGPYVEISQKVISKEE